MRLCFTTVVTANDSEHVEWRADAITDTHDKNGISGGNPGPSYGHIWKEVPMYSVDGASERFNDLESRRGRCDTGVE